ncbi:hypothetical protein QBC47DRAFT_387602 [Echria macrotheca]|uniref:N-acetyltransferase ESCO zinc-finger domain-containing protein n=1 Tax=Echria macrotheca TaxID=438768 RepID=A0AAJ0F9D4_9PEZI|nr:hypothetical protein QBC47DRAFT_387602 [Echria macrotheca]
MPASNTIAARPVPANNVATAVDSDAVPTSDVPVRKRPLIRTYGKRAAPRAEPEEPPVKKRRTESTEDAASSPTLASSPPKISNPEPLPKKGSILSFFKPVSSTSKNATRLSECALSTLTPPPSSPITPSGRKRGGPATKLNSERQARALKSEKQPLPRSGPEEQQEEDVDAESDDDETARHARTNGQDDRGVLRELSPDRLNGIPKPPDHGDKRGKKRLKRQSTKDMKQTTLSLAIDPKPGFTICRECDVLYNPLNESDRQEHKKRHAAYLRKKKAAESKKKAAAAANLLD